MSHSGQHQAPGAARTNVQKRRRKSHGLTIKIESPTTGEDSSAGIIDTSTMYSSASNIYLSGVSISRGHSPLSSPGPGPLTPPSPSRQGRSPSLSMAPASPLARTSRMRSASLAVASGHRTPPHSPGDHSTASRIIHVFPPIHSTLNTSLNFSLASTEPLRSLFPPLTPFDSLQAAFPWPPVSPHSEAPASATSASRTRTRPGPRGWALSPFTPRAQPRH